MFMMKSMNSDTVRHARRMAGDDDTVQRDINSLIIELKEAQLWDRIDVICVVADTEANSLLDLKGLQDSVVGSAAGAGPVWTSTGGFEVRDATTPTPINKWIDSQFNDSVSNNWVVGSNSMWCYLKSATFSGTTDRFMGASNFSDGVAHLVYSSSGNLETENESNVVGGSQTMSASGFFGGARVNSSTVNTHDDSGTTQTSSIGATLNLPSDPSWTVIVGGVNYFGSGISGQVDGNLTAWGFGDGFTHADWSALRTAVTNYLTLRGAA